MTCIVGLVEDGNVYIGGDSAGVAGLSISIRSDEKVFGNGPFIMGFTSSFRMGQLLRYKLAPPQQTVHQSDMEYLVNDFITAAQTCFVESGFGDKRTGGCFLLGYKEKLYRVDSDFQVGMPAANYEAVGCGADLALGAMYASKGKKPEERILLALEAAAKFSGGVAAPFVLVSQIKQAPTKVSPKVKTNTKTVGNKKPARKKK